MAGHYFTVRPATGLDARQVRGDAYLLNPDGTPWDPDDPARLAQLVDGEGPLKEALNATYEQFTQPWLEGLPTIIYGHSWTNSPGRYVPIGTVWHDRLIKRNNMPAASVWGISGASMAETAYCAVGNAWYTGYSGHATNPSGNLRTMPTNHLGAVIVDAEINDTIINVAGDAAHQLGFQHNLRAILAVTTAAQRLEAENATTKTAGWSAFTDTKMSAGSAQKTVTAGDYLEWVVTVPAGVTKLYVLTLVTDAGNPMGKIDVAVDGVTQTTAWEPTGKFKQFTSLTAVASTHAFGPAVIPVDVTPGSRTIRVTSNASNTVRTVYVDALIMPSATPPLVLVTKDAAVTYGTGATYKAAYDAIIDSVAAEFAALNVKVVNANADWNTATMLGPDGLHPNAAGQYQLANIWADALKVALTGYKAGITHKLT